MDGNKDLNKLIKSMSPVLNDGDYVFLSVNNLDKIDRNITIFEFKEREGTTVVIERTKADKLNYTYNYVASWITLMVHSSLEAVGLTSAFSTVLANNNISCNVIAGYYHDHIFVNKKDSDKAIRVLEQLSKNYK